ncbi:phage tail protein [Escherichia coli]|nr:phage tail protein [Escherichia coli]
MSIRFKTVITTAGAAKLAAATTTSGQKVNLTHMAVGDGNGNLPEPSASQTALVHEVWRGTLNKITQNSKAPNQVIAELVIPPEVGGFWMRELGLYDSTGTLIAVASMAESYKPLLTEGSGRAMTCRMIIIISDVNAVSLSVDSTTIMATQDYVDDKLAEHEQSRRHPDASLTQKGFTQLSSATNSDSESVAATPKAIKALNDTKAPLKSPALTGTPTAPTAAQGTNNTQIATTAYVRAAISALVGSSPEALDTLNELAAALGNDPNFATTMTNALAGKQPLDATLTALAGLTTGANKLPYFTGTDTVSQTDLTSVGRDILAKTSTLAVIQYLGLREIGTSGEKIPLLSTANTWSARQTFNGGITGALTGNADTATKLKTARNIGGVAFDGSADINLPGVNIAGNQNTTGNAATATKLQTARKISGVAFDGSADITLTAAHVSAFARRATGSYADSDGAVPWNAESGAYNVARSGDSYLVVNFYTGIGSCRTLQIRANYKNGGLFYRSSRDGYGFEEDWARIYTTKDNIPGVNTTGNQDTTGNAATATKLQTARTINGVSFDGSANISLSPENIGCPASPTGWLETGDNGASITTEQLVTLLRDNGAFNAKVWIARCAWAYAKSASIPDSETGCGIIPLAGAVIEVFSHSATYYTIRITTATTTSVSGALTNAEFIYVFNGTAYSPGWRRAYNTKNKPTAADVGALPTTGGTLAGGLTAAGEIISQSANGLRIAYGNYGFFIRNDGSSTYFMLTASGDNLGTWNSLRPLTINNANGAVSIGNGLNVTGDIRTNAWVYANRFSINSSSGSWISMRDQNVMFGLNPVSTSSAQALLRQDHADRKFFIGGLGNSQFGFYMINNSRTANGTDGQAFLDSSGNFQCGGQIVPANYSNFDSRYALKTAYISSVRLGSAASYKPSSNGVSWTQNLGSGLVMTGIIVQETGSNSADNIGGIYYRPVQYCINGTWYTAASV